MCILIWLKGSDRRLTPEGEGVEEMGLRDSLEGVVAGGAYRVTTAIGQDGSIVECLQDGWMLL